MNRCFVVACMLLIGPGITSAAAPSELPTEVQVVVDRYFSALQSGDTYTLQAVLGGDLRAKRSALLSNPSYPGHLVETNGDWVFNLLGYRTDDAGTMVVDYVMSLDDLEHVHKRLYMMRANADPSVPYQIVDERVLP